jgi:uncharacterized protein YcsI (UPF0317 family)
VVIKLIASDGDHTNDIIFDVLATENDIEDIVAEWQEMCVGAFTVSSMFDLFEQICLEKGIAYSHIPDVERTFRAEA